MDEQIVLKILDANLDRAREGLRVIEEWFRFGGGHPRHVETCKALRQQLGASHTEAMRSARDTVYDPGTALSHPDEAIREDGRDLMRVNLSRIQEALRVIEEYAKLSDPALGERAKQWRYQLYTLESAALGTGLRRKLSDCRLYLVTSPHPNLVAIVENALKGGLQLVQLREKEADARPVVTLGLRLRELCSRYEALLIVNDRVDLALAVEADGVHLGQTDLPIERARALLGPLPLIGQSTHGPEEALRATDEQADYIGVGPVYATPTKQGRTPVGLDYVRFCHEQIALPGYAIGGIDLTNLEAVLAAGADRVAVVRAIMAATDPERATAQFLEKLHG